jgi:hypothetical protein
MTDFDALITEIFPKTAAASGLPGDTSAQVAPDPRGSGGPGVGESMGVAQLPWRGALVGGLGGLAYNYLFDDDEDASPVASALAGAAAGIGGEYGLRAGGELARRHAQHGGSGLAVGATPVATTALGAGAGLGLARLLRRRRRRGEEA